MLLLHALLNVKACPGRFLLGLPYSVPKGFIDFIFFHFFINAPGTGSYTFFSLFFLLMHLVRLLYDVMMTLY